MVLAYPQNRACSEVACSFRSGVMGAQVCQLSNAVGLRPLDAVA
jgi:hypothetical protein